MSTDSSPLAGPNVLAILGGAVGAIRASPIILGLFLGSGILVFVFPSLIGSTLRLVLIPVGAVIAYQALDGRMRTDSPFVFRLFIAFLATLASYLMIGLGVVTLALPGVLGWVGFLVLVFAGLYIYTRLFLSTPAAMVDGYGPAEALSVSWRLMSGSVLATAFALALVFLSVIVVLGPVLWFIRSNFILSLGGVLILDSFLAGMQAFLYTELSETP